MASGSQRQADLGMLHPTVRGMVVDVLAELQNQNIPFRPFECFRSPRRQAALFAQGRTAPGSIVTKAGPWQSYHQYGLAVDFVLHVDGAWSWRTDGRYRAHWRKLHAIGRAAGLEPLSWELPHLQMAGLKLNDLRRGDYPPFGDDEWADNLEAAIADWAAPGAPPPPRIAHRPAIAAAVLEEAPPIAFHDADDGLAADGPLDRPATIPSLSENAMRTSAFGRIQAYIDKWEGGWADDPRDPGGATNMGITIGTFRRWRGRAVTKAELRALTRAEQRTIMKALYWDVVRGDDLPGPTAAVCYNSAILNGPKRAAEFLQSALKRQDRSIGVDGAIGPLSVAAAQAADQAQVIEDFVALQRAYLRGLPTWPVYGRGWSNRLDDVRVFAHTLVAAADPPDADDAADRPSAVVIKTEEAGSVPLGTVNGALGETIGQALNGRKTALGLGLAILSILAPDGAKAIGADAGGLEPYADIVKTIGGALAGWGVLGKFEKWTTRLRQAVAP